MYRIGVDVGGTFTDFALLDEADGAVACFKVPSTPHDPSQAIETGVRDMLRLLKIDPAQVSHFGHGTTVATNMIIEHRGVATGLLTTNGFRDVLEIGRQTRPDLYEYSVRKPQPLVPRHHRLEIDERLGSDGVAIRRLIEAEVAAAVARFKTGSVGAIAICFLHSYRNPEHEVAARRVVEQLMPGAYVSISSEVLPEFREYERMSTTVLNAYIGPRIKHYLDRFRTRIAAIGIATEPYTIHSNGGLLSLRTVERFPVRTCLSGPAAGVIGAAAIGAAAGMPDLVTFDVGGTSTDVSLVMQGHPLFTSNRLVADYPLKTPMIDIHVIGAGGGSVAWIDDGGALKVGPRSAGADPGPVAYGRGGVDPTLTDANVVLQRLNPTALLDGRMPIDREHAREIIAQRIAAPLGLSVETAAHGMLRIANANMSRAIRSVSTERGHDLAEFALFAYGGAGPLHAADVAVECNFRRVIVPQEPGTMCARGILFSDHSLDFVRSEIAPLSPQTWRRVGALFAEMRRDGAAWLEQEHIAADRWMFHAFVEARYMGQNFEVVVPMGDWEDAAAATGPEQFLDGFRQAHTREYGYDIPGREVEIVNCRLQVVGRVDKPRLVAPQGGPSLAAAQIDERAVYFGETAGWVATRIYRRSGLPPDAVIHGPAIVEEMSATTVILPDQRAGLDAIGNILINV